MPPASPSVVDGEEEDRARAQRAQVADQRSQHEDRAVHGERERYPVAHLAEEPRKGLREAVADAPAVPVCVEHAAHEDGERDEAEPDDVE